MITLTPAAQRQIESSLAKRGRGVGIRLGVRTAGCSGLAYVLEYLDSTAAQVGYTTFTSSTVTVSVSHKDEIYLLGLEVDYVRRGLNEGFEFTNPNSKGACGCGESFRV